MYCRNGHLKAVFAVNGKCTECQKPSDVKARMNKAFRLEQTKKAEERANLSAEFVRLGHPAL